MSMTYWPQEVAQILNQRMGFEHPLVNMELSKIQEYLSEEIKNVPLEEFLTNQE